MNERITGWKWIPVAALFFGVVLLWIHIDERGILLGIGVLLVGVMALIEGVKGNHHKRLTIDILQIILPLVIITAAIGNLVVGHAYYFPALVVFLVLTTVNGRKQLKGSAEKTDSGNE